MPLSGRGDVSFLSLPFGRPLSPLSHVSNLPATNCLLKVYSTSNTLERKLECQNFWTKTQYQRRIKREKLKKLAKNEIRRLEDREYTGIFTRKIQEIPGKCTSNIQKQTYFIMNFTNQGKIHWLRYYYGVLRYEVSL